MAPAGLRLSCGNGPGAKAWQWTIGNDIVRLENCQAGICRTPGTKNLISDPFSTNLLRRQAF